MIFLGILATAPALVAAMGRTRLALTVVLPISVVLAIGAGGGVWPWELDHRFYPIHLGHVVSQGARGFLNTTTPIDAGRFQQTDDLVNLAFVGLAMLMAWLLLVMRRPLLASLAAFAIYAIPSTVLLIGSDGIRAAIFLALVLLTLMVCREGHAERSRRPHRHPGAGARHAGRGRRRDRRRGAGREQGRVPQLAELEPAGRRALPGSAWATSGTRTTGRCTGRRRRPRCSR